MAGPSMSKVANGSIKPCRFVKLDTTAPGKVLQCSANTDVIYGISGPSTHYLPGDLGLDDGFHAVAGLNCLIYGFGDKEVMLKIGGTVTTGDRLTSDSDGAGVTTTTTGQWVGAEASVSGTSGQVLPVRPLSPAQY